jgi:hypothetical protein
VYVHDVYSVYYEKHYCMCSICIRMVYIMYTVISTTIVCAVYALHICVYMCICTLCVVCMIMTYGDEQSILLCTHISYIPRCARILSLKLLQHRVEHCCNDVTAENQLLSTKPHT